MTQHGKEGPGDSPEGAIGKASAGRGGRGKESRALGRPGGLAEADAHKHSDGSWTRGDWPARRTGSRPSEQAGGKSRSSRVTRDTLGASGISNGSPESQIERRGEYDPDAWRIFLNREIIPTNQLGSLDGAPDAGAAGASSEGGGVGGGAGGVVPGGGGLGGDTWETA